MKIKKKERSLQEIFEDWKWIFGYSRKYGWAIALYTFLGIFSASLGMVSSIAGKYLIDIITGYQTEKWMLLFLVMAGSSAASLLADCLISRYSAKLNVDILHNIQSDVFDKILDADWQAITKYSNGDLLNRFGNDVETISANAVHWIPKVLTAGYHFCLTFCVLLYYDWVMAFLAMGSAPFLLFVSRTALKKQRQYGKKVREMNSSIMSFETETFHHFDTIKSFGIGKHYSNQLHWWQRQRREVILSYNLFSIKMKIFSSVTSMLVQFAAFGYCLFRLWNHDITYGTMTLFLQQKNKLTSAFGNVVSILPDFLNSAVCAHRVRELTELPRECHMTEKIRLDEFSKNGLEVRMSGAGFAYSDGKNVIMDSDFAALPGEIVALVGPSGEGKTTMIRLILGLIRPQEGKVWLQNQKGEKLSVNADVRQLFTYVPQGNTVFSGTIAENLRMVREDASEEEIIAALKTACAWDFVKELKDTIYSRIGECGHGLSEGQAQRIAIARAVLRDAPILLLDEATSALDGETEKNVLKNIMKQRPDKTCIITTHRPGALALCHKVYRVQGNQVTELNEEHA